MYYYLYRDTIASRAWRSPVRRNHTCPPIAFRDLADALAPTNMTNQTNSTTITSETFLLLILTTSFDDKAGTLLDESGIVGLVELLVCMRLMMRSSYQ